MAVALAFAAGGAQATSLEYAKSTLGGAYKKDIAWLDWAGTSIAEPWDITIPWSEFGTPGSRFHDTASSAPSEAGIQNGEVVSFDATKLCGVPATLTATWSVDAGREAGAFYARAVDMGVNYGLSPLPNWYDTAGSHEAISFARSRSQRPGGPVYPRRPATNPIWPDPNDERHQSRWGFNGGLTLALKTADGRPIPVDVVIADAETFGSKPHRRFALEDTFRVKTSGGAWKVIENLQRYPSNPFVWQGTGFGSNTVEYKETQNPTHTAASTPLMFTEGGPTSTVLEIDYISAHRAPNGFSVGVIASCDWGDNPDSYGRPAHHFKMGAGLGGTGYNDVADLQNLEPLFLGTTRPDRETDKTADDNAQGDAPKDEDGVTVGVVYKEQTGWIVPKASIKANGTGTLHAWFDFNNDGSYGLDEYTSVAVTGGVLAGDLKWTSGTVGVDVGGVAYARFRITDDAAITAATPSAFALGGEVEDYPVPVEKGPAIEVIKSVFSVADTNGNGLTDVGDTVNYSFTVTNTGNTYLSQVTVSDDTATVAGGPIPLLAPGASDSVTFTASYVLTQADLDRGYVDNSATATGTPAKPDGTALNDATGAPLPPVTDLSDAGTTSEADGSIVPVTDPSGTETPSGDGSTDTDPTNDPTTIRLSNSAAIRVEKAASQSRVEIGSIVTYTLTVRNVSASMTVTTDVVDTLPEGISFRSGTARVDGAPATPVASGRTLNFEDLTFAPKATKILTFDAVVMGSAPVGDLVNRVQATSTLTGKPISNLATAVVHRAAEPVFDCGTVIGKVFEDINQDGYQNSAAREDGITDQTYYGDRYGKYDIIPVERRELGMPGVRLVTPNGTRIVTDEHGRFSVPCTALPGRTGAQFLLKVDTRTLPTGYRLTTENPRVVTLTAGKMTEMNFGASITKVARIDLDARAFAGNQPSDHLVAGLRSLVGSIRDVPTVVRVSYAMNDESRSAANARMRAVERVMRDLWASNGRYKLIIEKILLQRR